MKATKLTVMGLAIVAALALIWWCTSEDRVLVVADPDGKAALAPAGLPSPSQKPPKDVAVSRIKQIMEEGPPPPLSAEQLTAYVDAQKHSAASLLAAWSIGHDSAWLEEAAQRYPDDPRVALAKLSTLSDLKSDAKEWIERLKKNDPKNGLAWCYDAMSLLVEGAPEEARFALAEAVRLGRFDAHAGRSSTGIAAAYDSAGYDELSAGMIGMAMTPLPHAQLVMNLQKEFMKQRPATPDDALIQDMLHLSKNVRGQSDNGALIMNLVAASIERKVLAELNVLELVPGTKKLVVERMEELDQEKNRVRDLMQKFTPLMATMSDTQWKQYLRRSTVEGELKAMQWLVNQQPEAR